MVIVWSLFGLFIGSFANVVAGRSLNGESFWQGRSYCPRCKKNLRWFELLPIVSFALQRGRCRQCHKPISWRYPLAELGYAALFGLLAYVTPTWQPLAAATIVFSLLGALLLTDLEAMLLPDVLLKTSAVAAALMVLASQQYAASLLGLLAGAALPAVLVFVTRGRGMGDGDIWLGGMAGLVVGWPAMVDVLLLACIAGGIVGIMLIVGKKTKANTAVPFGPFLILATLAVWLMMHWPGQPIQLLF